MLKTLRKIQSKKGFTLIELMIVVAIIGILAAVAIPAFLKFIRKSKTTEAAINIKAIKNGAITWYDEGHTDSNGDPLGKHFPGSSSPSGIDTSGTYALPATALCGSGNPQYSKNAAQWEAAPFQSLKFGINKAHYFRYTYQISNATTTTNPSFTVIANADLDCDSSQSTYKMFSRKATNGEIESSNNIVVKALE